MSNHMIENVATIIKDGIVSGDSSWDEMAHFAITALKETGPNSFISEIINKYAGLHPMDEHGRKLWNNLIDAVLTMKEKT